MELIYRAHLSSTRQAARRALQRARNGCIHAFQRVCGGLVYGMPAWLDRVCETRTDRYAVANVQQLVPTAARYSPKSLWRQKDYLEKSIYLHRAKHVRELRACAQKLERAAAQIRLGGRPIIFAPLHIVSDVIPVLVVASMNLGCSHATVISSHGQGVALGPFEADSLKGLNLNLTQLDPLTLNSGEFKAAIQAIKQDRTHFVVFPDILPEITYRLNRKSMRTFDCSLFGRPAKLHSGLNDIARLAGATALFFCLIEQGGQLDIDILASVPAEQLPEQGPRVIEAAIRQHAEQWLLWHSPSLFYFNPSEP
ncbi:hypothetical protein FGA82_22115 [Pseudomonas fluorescens]|uniref:hypothetical protein n=1 Tax=Pseudomonas fluorescens TaxID=294 RepID=UPI001130B09B|nr:hypothetical protein [Pseudomonas fluorescens]TMU73966.1 hypothetical protein FGA82_22115 [Pseudomonas fluorescens]